MAFSSPGLTRRNFLVGVTAVGCAVGLAAVPGTAHADPSAPPPAGWGFDGALPEGRVLFDDSCTSLADAGWQVSPVANPGAYITDHAGTVANPLGLAFDPVPEGEYLMKGTPLAGIHMSTDSMAKHVQLGEGGWQIAFRMAVTDLMTPYRLPQWNGLRLWVQCGDPARGGRYFDINFTHAAEVALVMAGGAFQTIPVPGGWDGTHHDWLITFDGVETVRLHRDGEEIGFWTYAGSAVVIPEGVTFSNRTLDGVSGTNDVRFDQIAIAATQDRHFGDAAIRWADNWDVTPASSTVFFADHDRSGGSVDWMTDVDPGQYFVRARQRGAGRARWDDPLGLGSGAWSVEVDLRFAQYAYSGANASAEAIVAGWDLAAAGSRYRLGLRPDRSLVALGPEGAVELAPSWADANHFHRLRLTRAASGEVRAFRDDHLLGVVPATAASDGDHVDLTVGDESVYGAIAVWVRSIDVVRGHPQTYDPCNDLAQYWSEPSVSGSVILEPAAFPARAGECLGKALRGGHATVDLRVPIRGDDGQWTVSTTLRFADFRYGSADRQQDVLAFGWDIVVAGRRHRLGWRPDGALVADAPEGRVTLVPAPDGVWNTWPFITVHTWRLGGDGTGRLLVHRDGMLVGTVPGGVATDDPDRIRMTVGHQDLTGPVAAVVSSVTVARDIDPEWFTPVIAAVAIDPASDMTAVPAAVAVEGWDPDHPDIAGTTLRWSLVDAAGAERDHGTLADWHGGGLVAKPLRPGEYTLKAFLERDGRRLAAAARTIRLPRRCHLTPSGTGTGPGTGQDALVVDLTRSAVGWQTRQITLAGLERTWPSVSTAGDGDPIAVGSGWDGQNAVSIGVTADSEALLVRIGDAEHVVRPPEGGVMGNELVEWYVGTADLSGAGISIAPIPGSRATVAYVRLRRLDRGEARLAGTPDEGAAGKRAAYNNDGTTDIVLKKATTVDELRTVSAGRYRDTDVGRLFYGIGATTMAWSNSAVVGTVAENYDLTPEQFALMRSADRTVMDFMMANVTDEQCPLSVVAAAGAEFGLEVIASLRMSAFYSQEVAPWLNGPHYPELYDQYRMVGFDGGRPADSATINGLSLTHQSYRELLVDLLAEQAALSGVAGVELDFCRRPKVLGWDEEFRAGYRNEYGVDPRDELEGAGLQRLLAYRADILTGFLRTIRDRLPGKTVCVRVPYGYTYELGMDVRTWAEDGLIDVLTVSTWTLEDFWQVDSTWPDVVAGTDVELYGGIEAVINGQDSSKTSERLAAGGIRSNVTSARMTRQQYRFRAAQFYAAGYDGVYIFNNPYADHSLGQVGDKVAVAKWREFGYPAELHVNRIE